MNANKDQTDQQSRQDVWKQLDAEDGKQATAATDAELESAVRQEPTPEPAPQADTGNSEATNDDPVKEELAGLKTLVNQLQTRLRNTEGHIGGLTNQLRGAQAAAQEARKAGGDAPSSSELSAAAGDATAMARLKEEYPEFGDLFDKALHANLAPLASKLRQLEQRGLEQSAPSIDVEQRLASFRKEWEVETKHPGWQEEVRTPAFTGWLQAQPREVQMLAQSDDTRDAIRLLDMRQASRARPQTQNHLQTAAAIPSGRGIGNVKPVDLNSMSREQLWKYYDQLDSSQRA